MSNREDKRSQFQQHSKKKIWLKSLIFSVITVSAVVGAYLTFTPQATIDGNKQVVVNDGVVRIPVNQIDDGAAHYYSYSGDQGEVKFFILKSSDGVFRAAFDACDVCYRAKQGYRQEGDKMVCNNCNMIFASTRINEVKGGCNPAPLKRSIQGDELIIEVKNIEAGSWYFQG